VLVFLHLGLHVWFGRIDCCTCRPRTAMMFLIGMMMMTCWTRHIRRDVTNHGRSRASSGNNQDVPHTILSSASESAGPKRSKPLGSATWHFFHSQSPIPICLPCHSHRVMAYSIKPFVHRYKYRLFAIVPPEPSPVNHSHNLSHIPLTLTPNPIPLPKESLTSAFVYQLARTGSHITTLPTRKGLARQHTNSQCLPKTSTTSSSSAPVP
jgi:hypothetical protein